ncbi:MAG TPA: hypothetical protein VLM76_14680 [Patescibacteria group bacterium]|nr:hypothetical protein [Patescibacteria group bacterium]
MAAGRTNPRLPDDVVERRRVVAALTVAPKRIAEPSRRRPS